MKRILAAVIVALAVLLCWGAAWAETREETVSIKELANGEDGQSMGYIEQLSLLLQEGDSILIDMSRVYEMYPDANGIYGILYAENQITLTPDLEGVSPAEGSGFLEFSFPGSSSCTLTGTGNVYAYFLPVPYMRLSSDVSLVGQSFDPAYLTSTAVNHQNMFMLTDPHLWIYQNNIPFAGTVYKKSFILGELPEQYAGFAHDPMHECLFPFVSELPLLVQCDALLPAAYEQDQYHARPMEEIYCSGHYSVWCYKDYDGPEDMLGRIEAVFDTCLDIAYEQFLDDGLKVDPCLIVLLNDELHNEGLEGKAVGESSWDRQSFQNYLYLNTASWEENADYLSFLCAHETGHLIQNSTLTTADVWGHLWFQEGFADFFAEKVCEKLSISYHEPHSLSQADALLIDRFSENLAFGIHDWETYEKAWSNNTIFEAEDPYSFGYLFMLYLEDQFGTGFYRGISNSFRQYYAGHENEFFGWRSELSYNLDLFYEMVRTGLSEDVYLRYPEYASVHYGDRIAAP